MQYQTMTFLKKFPNKNFLEWLKDAYLNPLKDLGFTCDNIASTAKNNNDLNFHVLHLNHDGQTSYKRDWLETICTQDDDSQPHSTYTLYMGELWVFIPFYT
jgi:hypothetical protein